MKALDTPVLLEILHGGAAAKELLRSLRGEEVATTEINLFELAVLAADGPKAGREVRETALLRLRRRITVLPITAEAVREASRLLRAHSPSEPGSVLVWGALAAAGCGEWVTTRPFAPPQRPRPFKVRIAK